MRRTGAEHGTRHLTPDTMKERWSLHFCPFDKVDRKYVGWRDLPWRVHLNTPWFHFAFAVRPESRFAKLNKRSTWTTLKVHSSDRWLW